MVDPCILIITCLIFDQVIGVDHIQVHTIIAKWEKYLVRLRLYNPHDQLSTNLTFGSQWFETVQFWDLCQQDS